MSIYRAPAPRCSEALARLGEMLAKEMGARVPALRALRCAPPTSGYDSTCWGSNAYGQLGIGNLANLGRTSAGSVALIVV
jgi:hypothetical protein